MNRSSYIASSLTLHSSGAAPSRRCQPAHSAARRTRPAGRDGTHIRVPARRARADSVRVAAASRRSSVTRVTSSHRSDAHRHRDLRPRLPMPMRTRSMAAKRGDRPASQKRTRLTFSPAMRPLRSRSLRARARTRGRATRARATSRPTGQDLHHYDPVGARAPGGFTLTSGGRAQRAGSASYRPMPGGERHRVFVGSMRSTPKRACDSFASRWCRDVLWAAVLDAIDAHALP